MSCTRPTINDPEGDFSFPCPRRVGLKELDRIHRTLPAIVLKNEDLDVLQDEAAFAILDEITGGYIFDDLKKR
jgi:hypothetical protein